MAPYFWFDPSSDEEVDGGGSQEGPRQQQSPWEFTAYSESVAEEHARRNTTSVDAKISRALQECPVPLPDPDVDNEEDEEADGGPEEAAGDELATAHETRKQKHLGIKPYACQLPREGKEKREGVKSASPAKAQPRPRDIMAGLPSHKRTHRRHPGNLSPCKTGCQSMGPIAPACGGNGSSVRPLSVGLTSDEHRDTSLVSLSPSRNSQEGGENLKLSITM